MKSRGGSLSFRPQSYVIALSIVLGAMSSSNVLAQVVFTVNSTADQVDDDASDGICHTATGSCTLRAAIMQANRNSTATDTVIHLPAGTYALSQFAAGEPDSGGALLLTAPATGNPVITIIGAGAATTLIDANPINPVDRVLRVVGGRAAVISGISLRNGKPLNDAGGGIANSGDLTLSDCTISNNSFLNSNARQLGGGIYNDGRLVLTRVTLSANKAQNGGAIANASPGYIALHQSTLSANQAAADGGGIFTSSVFAVAVGFTRITGNSALDGGGIFIVDTGDGGGLVTVADSSVSSNQASSGGGISNYGVVEVTRSTVAGNTAGDGGGVHNLGTLIAVNSTFSGNSAAQDGGGIWNGATSDVYNSTIAFNQADANFDEVGAGAGIFNKTGATFRAHNSVIAGNAVQVDHANEDCYGSLDSFGRNKISDSLFGDLSHCSISQEYSGNFSPLNSLDELSTLRDNGGPTLTHALVAPSGMIDGADNVLGCVDQHGALLSTDQRGHPRVVGTRCDIGAFEYSDIIFQDSFELAAPIPQ